MRRGPSLIVAALLALLVIVVVVLTLRDPSPASSARASSPESSSVVSAPVEPEPPSDIARQPTTDEAALVATAPATARSEPGVPIGRLEVLVVWADTGAPSAGVEVTLVPLARGGFHFTSTARSDAEGLARFERVEAGPVHVMGERSGAAEARVAADLLTRVELRVARGLLVEGRVVAALGALVSQPEVWLYNDGRWRRVAEADDFGRFALEGIQRGSLLMARARAWSSRVVRVDGAEGATVGVELAVDSEGAWILGQVLDREERPVAGAVVAVEVPEPPSQGFISLAGKLYVTTQTDDEGRFALAGQGAEQRLVVCAPRFVIYESVIDCTPTGERIEHILRLVDGAVLTGRLTLEDGAPAAGAFVAVGNFFEDTLLLRCALTDAHGD